MAPRPPSQGLSTPSTWHCQHILGGHRSWVRAVAVSADGQIIASGSGDRTVKLWSLATGELLHTLSGHTSWVRAIAFAPGSDTLVSGSWDGTVRVWQETDGADGLDGPYLA
ncbi:MAG TPA: hypothetical protein IGS37_12830 [Synechococcales cyanobacterium M55_K2018_004]|nr:hypothetical protein [Synechococcales cyanobacterium M55_K2018_004]